MKTFAEFLHAKRTAANVSLHTLAAASNLSAGYLSRIERGIQPPPSPDAINRIAEAFGADPLPFHIAAAETAGYFSLPCATSERHDMLGRLLMTAWEAMTENEANTLCQHISRLLGQE